MFDYDKCADYRRLELVYFEAWSSHNHDKVMSNMRLLRKHKENCPICSNRAGLAASLWPDHKVVLADGSPAPQQ